MTFTSPGSVAVGIIIPLLAISAGVFFRLYYTGRRRRRSTRNGIVTGSHRGPFGLRRHQQPDGAALEEQALFGNNTSPTTSNNIASTQTRQSNRTRRPKVPPPSRGKTDPEWADAYSNVLRDNPYTLTKFELDAMFPAQKFQREKHDLYALARRTSMRVREIQRQSTGFSIRSNRISIHAPSRTATIHEHASDDESLQNVNNNNNTVTVHSNEGLSIVAPVPTAITANTTPAQILASMQEQTGTPATIQEERVPEFRPTSPQIGEEGPNSSLVKRTSHESYFVNSTGVSDNSKTRNINGLSEYDKEQASWFKTVTSWVSVFNPNTPPPNKRPASSSTFPTEMMTMEYRTNLIENPSALRRNNSERPASRIHTYNDSANHINSSGIITNQASSYNRDLYAHSEMVQSMEHSDDEADHNETLTARDYSEDETEDVIVDRQGNEVPVSRITDPTLREAAEAAERMRDLEQAAATAAVVNSNPTLRTVSVSRAASSALHGRVSDRSIVSSLPALSISAPTTPAPDATRPITFGVPNSSSTVPSTPEPANPETNDSTITNNTTSKIDEVETSKEDDKNKSAASRHNSTHKSSQNVDEDDSVLCPICQGYICTKSSDNNEKSADNTFTSDIRENDEKHSNEHEELVGKENENEKNEADDYDENADDIVRLLSCNHVFHDECITPWLTMTKALCPLCKKDFRNEIPVEVLKAQIV